MPASLTFRDASSRDVFTTIARFANISLIFDSAFRDAPVTVDLRNATLEDALNTVAGATRTFFRVTAPKTVVIVPDTPAKRREYEEEVVRTFYLSNADLKETMDLLRLVLDARRISPTTATNALTIKDTPENVAAAGRVLSAIDKARPGSHHRRRAARGRSHEAARIRPADRLARVARHQRIGERRPAPTGRSRCRRCATCRSPTSCWRTCRRSTTACSRPTRTRGRSPTRSFARRTASTAQARFGDRVPVPVTTFAPIATGGTPQQPITSFNYENIGVNIDITPRTHHDDDVTLALKVAVTSISGTDSAGCRPSATARSTR